MSAESVSPAVPSGSRLSSWVDRISEWPWWLLAAASIGLYIVYQILTDDQTGAIFDFLKDGLWVTVQVAIMAYALAVTIGLITGLARVSRNKVIYNIASFYVEVIRGVPMLVLLFYVAFAILPLLVDGLNTLGLPISTRDISSIARVVAALGIGYGAYSAEIFRAGIQSIEKGQYEAASALGMSYFQTMRYVVLPQALRRVLPALGNDFISMVKDSALVSVLGVRDLTQLSKLYSSSTFIYFQTWSMTAFIYLSLTVLLTRLVRLMETRLHRAYQR